MPSIFEKLNLKDQREILVVNAPPSFESQLTTLTNVSVVRDPKKSKTIHFALAFATRQSDVDALSTVLAAKADGDALLWFAYPKGTSRNYTCDFNRDTGWRVLKRLGFDTVRAWPSMRTGRRCASGVSNSSSR